MSDKQSSVEYARALEDFRRARGKARLQHLWASVTGQTKELMPYDEISSRLRTSGASSKGVRDIPIDAIVGSVNRYQDFDRDFLPLHDKDMERWARVKTVMTSPGSPGLPPIRVYKIGDAYFVLDGNHRVSIAREMGISSIEAYVTEVQTRVPLSPEDSPEEFILKAEHEQFLRDTRFDSVVPDGSLALSFPGQYATLREHIHVHKYYMGIEQSREIPLEEAVRHWYDQVYRPAIEIIRDLNVLDEFPDRTETDLYIWVLDHQTFMEKEFGWSVRPDKAASDLVNIKSKRLVRVFRRIKRKILSALLPKQLEDFSSPGEWHEQKSIEGQSLFADILVAMSGASESWIALEQAIFLAQLEHAEVRGLIIRQEDDTILIDESDLAQAFRDRLDQAALQGNLTVVGGPIAETICKRAEVNDLVVLKLSHPPSTNIFSRFFSGMRLILRRSTRPVLVVKNQTGLMHHLLLAYDGSPKGKEALFVGAYLAGKYHRTLTVLVVDDDEERGMKLLKGAEEYLGDCCASALFRQEGGQRCDVILKVADDISADMILMGGYGFSPVLELLFGSTVDEILRGTNIPVMVCK